MEREESSRVQLELKWVPLTSSFVDPPGCGLCFRHSRCLRCADFALPGAVRVRLHHAFVRGLLHVLFFCPYVRVATTSYCTTLCFNRHHAETID